MQASRELDALVAEKVMGYTLRFAAKAWTDADWMGSDTPTETNVMAIYAPFEQFPRSGAFDKSIPHYSTDIAAAWEVVEKLYERGLCVGVSTLHEWKTKCECSVYYADMAQRMVANADADTAPHAICLAALKALEVRE